MTTIYRKFGVELECYHPTQGDYHRAATLIRGLGEPAAPANYTGRNYTLWQIKPDGSLRGSNTVEFVSPVLPGGETGIERVSKVANLLDRSGYKINVSCGYHLNIDVPDLTVSEIAAIALRYNLHAEEIKTFLPKSRYLNNTYVNFAERGTEAFRKILGAALASNSTAAWGHDERYTVVNLQHTHACPENRRIEFRQAAGTLNAEKIVNWYEFICEFIAETLKLVREHRASRTVNTTRPTVDRCGRAQTVSEVIATLPARVPNIVPNTDAERFLARLCSRRIITTADAREFGWVTGISNNIDSRLRVTAHALRRLGANLRTTTFAGELAYTVEGFEPFEVADGRLVLAEIFTLPTTVRSRRVNDSRGIEEAPTSAQINNLVQQPIQSPAPTRLPLDEVLRTTPLSSGLTPKTIGWLNSRKLVFAEDVL